MVTTKSGKPTFGVAKYETVAVKTKDGTVYAAYHDGETWYEGHYSATTTSGNVGGCAAVQMADPPVSLESD